MWFCVCCYILLHYTHFSGIKMIRGTSGDDNIIYSIIWTTGLCVALGMAVIILYEKCGELFFVYVCDKSIYILYMQ